MAREAVLVWSNALGDGAPFFVPVEILAGAMAAATDCPWDAVCSQAYWAAGLCSAPADPSQRHQQAHPR